MKREVTAIVVAGLVLASGPATADDKQPPPMKDIKVDEKIGASIPLDLEFTEASGERVRLERYFRGERPVLMVLAYVRCSMLCSLVLRGVANAVDKLDLVAGEDYRVVTVSIDPRESPAEAAAKRRELLEQIGRSGEPEAWTYLLGAKETTRRLADRLGFGYAWDPRTEQFAHPAVAFVLTPDGTISRYFYGIEFPPGDVRGALEAAGRGETVETELAQSVLSCFRFDPALARYRSRIQRYFQIGAFALFTTLASVVVFLFLRERRRRS